MAAERRRRTINVPFADCALFVEETADEMLVPVGELCAYRVGVRLAVDVHEVRPPARPAVSRVYVVDEAVNVRGVGHVVAFEKKVDLFADVVLDEGVDGVVRVLVDDARFESLLDDGNEPLDAFADGFGGYCDAVDDASVRRRDSAASRVSDDSDGFRLRVSERIEEASVDDTFAAAGFPRDVSDAARGEDVAGFVGVPHLSLRDARVGATEGDERRTLSFEDVVEVSRRKRVRVSRVTVEEVGEDFGGHESALETIG